MKSINYQAWFIVNSFFFLSFISLCAFSYGINIDSELLEFRYERLISIASLTYFILLLLVSFKSIKAFWFIYPFVILTVPNAVNSVIPGLLLTHIGERGNASFAYVSHIDFYLISNILINIYRRKLCIKSSERGNTQLLFLCTFLGVGLLINSVYEVLRDNDYIFILNGAFHYRYLFLTTVVAYQLKAPRVEVSFVNGLMLAIPVLALEAFVSTYLGGANLIGELKSGNFANNVFGNFLGLLFIFFFVLDKGMTFSPMFHRITVLLLLVLLIMTGVRGAMLSILIGLLAYFILIRITPLRIFSYVITCFLALLALVVGLDLLHLFDYLVVLFNSFEIILAQGYGASGVVVDENNSSLITRVAIWKSTVLMTIDNWLFGVGASQWNFLKESYGVPFKVLLDPHNDYLNFFCLYGVPGLLFIYILYVKPSLYVLNSNLKSRINPYQISLFTLAISSITNANNSKHQVFAIIITFIILSIVFNEKLNKEKRSICIQSQ